MPCQDNCPNGRECQGYTLEAGRPHHFKNELCDGKTCIICKVSINIPTTLEEFDKFVNSTNGAEVTYTYKILKSIIDNYPPIPEDIINYVKLKNYSIPPEKTTLREFYEAYCKSRPVRPNDSFHKGWDCRNDLYGGINAYKNYVKECREEMAKKEKENKARLVEAGNFKKRLEAYLNQEFNPNEGIKISKQESSRLSSKINGEWAGKNKSYTLKVLSDGIEVTQDAYLRWLLLEAWETMTPDEINTVEIHIEAIHRVIEEIQSAAHEAYLAKKAAEKAKREAQIKAKMEEIKTQNAVKKRMEELATLF
jgi:hypothetical protein